MSPEDGDAVEELVGSGVDPAHVRPAAPSGNPRSARRLPRRVWVLAGLCGLVALITRLPRLGRPGVLVFDEVFYATQGWEVSRTGVEQGSVVHPPLAKWLLAAGIKVFGFTPLGWRIVPLLAGIVVVMATVIAAYRLLGNLAAAGLAGAVVLTDGIAFTSGRLALLDGILAAFTTVALAFIATAVSRPLDIPLRRRMLIGTGIALGAAVACKWSALPLIPMALLVFGVLSWRTSDSTRTRRLELGRTALFLLAVPFVLYCATYVPTLVRFDNSAVGREHCGRTHHCHPGYPERVGEIIKNQGRVWHFHESLVPTNRYANNAVSWVFQTEPVGLLSSSCPSADPVCSPGDKPSVRRVIGVSNPMVWFLGTVALVVTLLLALRRLDPRRGVIVGWAVLLWLPWVVRPHVGVFPLAAARPGYSFYATPLVPALALALGACWVGLRGPKRRVVGIVFSLILLLGAVLLYPTWTGMATSRGYLQGLVEPHRG